MKVTITHRTDGSARVGTHIEKHWATGLPYGDDEIEIETVIDIPGAYQANSGIAFTDRQGMAWDIYDHPLIRKALRN